MKEISKMPAIVVLFILLLIAATSIHPFGLPSDTRMDDYFIEHGQEETGTNNIVTSVVFDYRALDTLGESTVLFAATCGIFIAFLGRRRK